jgi:hypothetical protein
MFLLIAVGAPAMEACAGVLILPNAQKTQFQMVWTSPPYNRPVHDEVEPRSNGIVVPK